MELLLQRVFRPKILLYTLLFSRFKKTRLLTVTKVSYNIYNINGTFVTASF